MTYSKEEHNALMEENTLFDNDALHNDYMASQGNLTKISDMATFENKSAFESLKEEMDWGGVIDLTFKIINGCPYYRFFSVSASETKSLNLNKPIIKYLYDYFVSNVLGDIPIDYAGSTKASEKYLLHLLKRDRKNGKLSYDPEIGYKATYNRISVNYGKLPYTPEELDDNLNAL